MFSLVNGCQVKHVVVHLVARYCYLISFCVCHCIASRLRVIGPGTRHLRLIILLLLCTPLVILPIYPTCYAVLSWLSYPVQQPQQGASSHRPLRLRVMVSPFEKIVVTTSGHPDTLQAKCVTLYLCGPLNSSWPDLARTTPPHISQSAAYLFTIIIFAAFLLNSFKK